MSKIKEKQKIKIVATVEIPDDHILVSLEEYDRLKKLDTLGQTGNSEWFEQQLPFSFQVARERILIPFRDELEDFVLYPETTGQPWKFAKTKMLKWLDDNWARWCKK